MTTYRPSSICGSKGAEVLHYQEFYLPEGHPLAGGYDVGLKNELVLLRPSA